MILRYEYSSQNNSKFNNALLWVCLLLLLVLSFHPTTAWSLTRMINISTNGDVTDYGMKAGFIIRGTEPREIVVLGEQFGPGIDPVLTLTDISGSPIATNDNWRDSSSAADVERLLGRPPGNDLDAAFVITLDPGVYIAVLTSGNGQAGKGIVSINDFGPESTNSTRLINISTNGELTDYGLRAGFIIRGTSARELVILGEKFSGSTNPELTLTSISGEVLRTNSDWRSDSTAADVERILGRPPGSSEDAAFVITLNPGVYIATLTSSNGQTGKGIVSINDFGTPDGDGAATASGVFKDSNVSGMSYASGKQSGVTGTNGSYTYESGQPVTFSIGGVTIGTITGKPVSTPIDLFPGASSSSRRVQNIVRFLLMLDQDGDPENGIEISSAVREIASTWTQVNFDTDNLETELISIMSDAASVDGTPHFLPGASTARAHLEATFRCVHAGAFLGTFQGGDNGTFGVLIDAETGLAIGGAYSNGYQQLIGLLADRSINIDQQTAFIAGNATSGATFNGQLISPNQVRGNWSNSSIQTSGSFSGERAGGSVNAVYRFTGRYLGNDAGIFSFDLDGNDHIKGIVYTILGNQLFDLSGSVNGTSMSATLSDGTKVTGTLNKATGRLRGTWDDSPDGLSGTYSGSGCKLN